MTDSRVLPKTFGKRHTDALRAYDKLQYSTEFNRHNFVSVEYTDEKGELRRFVKMTKDGFTMLATGWTGADEPEPGARHIRERFRSGFYSGDAFKPDLCLQISAGNFSFFLLRSLPVLR